MPRRSRRHHRQRLAGRGCDFEINRDAPQWICGLKSPTEPGRQPRIVRLPDTLSRPQFLGVDRSVMEEEFDDLTLARVSNFAPTVFDTQDSTTLFLARHPVAIKDNAVAR